MYYYYVSLLVIARQKASKRHPHLHNLIDRSRNILQKYYSQKTVFTHLT